jgi:hypothetical protein
MMPTTTCAVQVAARQRFVSPLFDAVTLKPAIDA